MSVSAAAAPAEAETTVLDVTASLSGRRWRSRDGDARAGLALAQRLALPELVGRLLAARGVGLDEAAAFLDPRLRDALPDPQQFKDMDAAVERLVAALENAEPIAVFGDYDVDGATSAAVLAHYFAAVGCPLRIYVPDRLTEGYGPNAPALLRLRAEGIRVVITVDCGTLAFEALEEAAAAGVDVIVVDHHAAEPRLPAACAVVNPNRLDDASPHGQLAAVGVTFLLAVALNSALRDRGRFAERAEPDLMALLDMVALGTVADVVPLTGANRALVAQGLKVLAQRRNVGLAALADVAGVSERPTAYHLGFVLGPRINAGGRVGEADMGARLLTARDAGEARTLAERLDAYNRERRELEAVVLEEALAQAETRSGAALVVADDGWHPGVIGIVASRLKDRYQRPTCVVALEGDIGKGSGRSVAGVDLGAAVIAARQAGILEAGGGHKMAAGFTVRRDRLDELRAFLDARVADVAQSGALVPTLNVDGVVAVRGADTDLVAALDRLAPYGAGNPEPRLALARCHVVRADVVGADHVRCVLSDANGGSLKAIAFRQAAEPLGQALLGARGRALNVAGHLRADTWQGREGVQLIVDDAAWA